MTDEIKHECAVAMVVLRRPPSATGDFGGTKLSLLLEKQHNRGQDGAGAAILRARPVPGEEPYWIAKSASATPLADVLRMIAKRSRAETGLTGLTGLSEGLHPTLNSSAATLLRSGDTPYKKNLVNPVNPVKESFDRIFLGHLRYATFGKNDTAFCHPFVHESSDLKHTLLLAGNFNLTNAHELFDDYARHGSFPTSKADGYLICELIAKKLGRGERPARPRSCETHDPTKPLATHRLASAISRALANADGAWTLCGATGDGWAFATRDPCGIRPGFYYVDENVVVVASERPAIQAAFDVPPEAVKELPPGQTLVVSPSGEVECCQCGNIANTNNQHRLEIGNITPRPCSFERIYFSRANDADIHRERKALGAALLPRILKAAETPIEDIFFSYIPNSARIAFHGLLEAIFSKTLLLDDARTSDFGLQTSKTEVRSLKSEVLNSFPRFGEVIVKDAKFRTFIADAAARREFYKHVYDVTYGLVRAGKDTLVVLDDSIVRGNTMKNAILPMLDRLGPKRIVIASSAPPIRYPDCYGIDMSTLGELVAFKALVNLLGADAEKAFRSALVGKTNLADLYARFTDEEHCAEIARLLTPPGMKAEVRVVYQSVEDLRRCLTSDAGLRTSTMEVRRLKSEVSSCAIGDWYFTGDYPTPGGYKVLKTALQHYLEKNNERSY